MIVELSQIKTEKIFNPASDKRGEATNIGSG